MNFLFIIAQNERNLQDKVLLLIFCLFFSIPIFSQDNNELIEPRSYNLEKSWFDKNGENSLLIHIENLCIPDKTIPMGFKSKITVRLKNNRYHLKTSYNNPDYEMSMISFYEDDLVLKSIDGADAVFIPIFYCGNSDSQVKVSYIILHNNKKYLKHIHFYCTEYGTCSLNDDLDKILKGMPDYLKKEFINQLSRYKILPDFHQEFY